MASKKTLNSLNEATHDALSLKAAIDRAYQEPPTAAEKKWRRLSRHKHRQLVVEHVECVPTSDAQLGRGIRARRVRRHIPR